MIATYENNHTGRTITGEFNRFAFDAVHDPAYHDLYRTACDKLTAKQYVKDQIGEQYVAQLFEVADSPEEVMARTDRSQYILKYNMNSSKNSFVIDGRLISPHLLELPQKLGTWYFWDKRPKKFFSEEILSKDMFVWNFYCYKGNILLVRYLHDEYPTFEVDPKSIVHVDRYVTYPDFVALPWKLGKPDPSLAENGIEVGGWTTEGIGDQYKSYGDFRKADNWKEMIELVKELSTPFPLVRCDMYEADGKVVFSEFTATFRSFDVSEESSKYLMEKIRCH